MTGVQTCALPIFGIDRVWRRVHDQDWIEPLQVEERIAKEIKFDPDLWLIEVEDRQGRCFLDLAKES